MFSLRLGMGLGSAMAVADPVSISIDTAPAVTGTAQVGQTLTRTVGSYSGDGTITVSNGRWTRNGVDIDPAETGATYTLVAADDETSVRWEEDVADAGSGDSLTARSNALSITYAAPLAADALEPVSYDTGSGDRTVDASVDFTGSAIVYSVFSVIPGVTINSSTGVVTIPTDADAVGTITVTGTNSGGSDSTDFGVTIDAAPVFDAPVLSGLDASGAPDALELDVDIACDLYWSLDPTGTNPNGETIVAGGITDSGGPDAISAGANVIAFDFSAIAAGTYDLSFVASNSGTLSNVLRQEITLADAGTWAITGGDNTLTVTDQPTAPTSPTITGGELTLNVTG